MGIIYTKGDATDPQRPECHRNGPMIIAHICNNEGAWGAGFVVPLGKRYPGAKAEYLGRGHWNLGETQFIFRDDIIIANMIAQTLVGDDRVKYPALRNCLLDVADMAIRHGASVHMPRIGCGLAGSNWDKMEGYVWLIAERGITVTVYDLP
jgi:hypothetical protein